jgi:hypothetical protein
VEEDRNLDIFEMRNNISEPTMEWIIRKLLTFMHYERDIKDMKRPLEWWEKHENMFLTIGFYVKQIVRTMKSQFEIKRIFL